MLYPSLDAYDSPCEVALSYIELEYLAQPLAINVNASELVEFGRLFSEGRGANPSHLTVARYSGSLRGSDGRPRYWRPLPGVPLYIEHPRAQPFHLLRITMVEETAGPGVQRCDGGNVIPAQFKVEHIEILHHSFLAN